MQKEMGKSSSYSFEKLPYCTLTNMLLFTNENLGESSTSECRKEYIFNYDPQPISIVEVKEHQRVKLHHTTENSGH